ncbi:MAG: glycosyltransferase family 2 protein [Armatimonadota bacterium]
MILLLEILLGAVAATTLVSTVWLGAVLVSATRRRSAPGPAADLRVAVVVPAHDEELVLGETLRGIAAQRWPSERLSVVVVADNCTDGTARIAREAGAVVMERTDPVERGKGFALAWAFGRLLGSDSPIPGPVPDAFVILDADTWAEPTMVEQLVAALPDGANGLAAVQGRYGVLNPEGGWRAALMSAAFELCNHVRLLGIDRLGASVGLKGNGMIFSRATLERVPWTGRSVTEDIDYGLDLLEHHGVRVRYAPDAVVRAQMPVTAGQGASQRARWEGGRYRLMRRRVPQLLLAAVRRRDARLIAAALDLSALPLAEIVALLCVGGAGLAAGGSSMLPAVRFALAGALGTSALALAAYVLFGMRVAGAGPEAYRALLRVPMYVLWKLTLYVRRRASGAAKPAGADDEWVRTERIEMGSQGETMEQRSGSAG